MYMYSQFLLNPSRCYGPKGFNTIYFVLFIALQLCGMEINDKFIIAQRSDFFCVLILKDMILYFKYSDTYAHADSNLWILG